ncbi:MAG: HAD-IB family phosphatase [Chloroflexi bacterium]|nr:HAD-IB family phosphatase [Chloroflexota bacterium]
MRWPHYEHVFFDCDSTLTTIEGIDVLADYAGKKWRVEVLTRAAMDGELDLEEVYGKRLQAVKPTREQIRSIRQAYKRNVVEDAAAVIAALQHLGHKVYIISGGLAEPVEEFGIFLGVPQENIRAVGVAYNQLSGDWWLNNQPYTEGDMKYLTFEEGALTISDGKAQIVRELLAGQRGRSLLIGDGNSDLLAGTAVDLFVGYGGIIERPRVRDQSPIYLHTTSLAPLTAVAAGPAAQQQLHNSPHLPVFQKGLDLIQTGALTFNDERLKSKFTQALHATRQTLHPRTNGSPS